MKFPLRTSLYVADEELYKESLKTTTQIMLEEGSRVQKKLCGVGKKMFNFNSFDLRDPRYGIVDAKQEAKPTLMTSYMYQFAAPYPVTCKPITQQEFSPDPLFNRLPKNDFDPKTGEDFKFLDDHMSKVTEARKKINYFRQLRNKSFIL